MRQVLQSAAIITKCDSTDVANDTVEDVEVRVEDDLVYNAEREQQSIAIKLMYLQ